MHPLVSVVTLNWNQAEVTCDLLASLARVRYPRLEVVVVDNGSRPGDAAVIGAHYPRPRLVRSHTNLGFTGGNNLGMRHALGEYVLLLNNDTEVEADFLQPLVDAMEADPGLGACSPKIRYFDEPERIQYAGGTAVHPLRAQARWIGSGEEDRGQHDASGPTEMGHGAALLIRRRVLEEVGLLGDDFFLCYEELDFGTRLRRAGWRMRYVAESVVWHKESVSLGKASAQKVFFQTRGRMLYVRRNAAGLQKAAALLLLALVVGPFHTLRHLAVGRWRHAAAVVAGMGWHLLRLYPGALRRDGRLAPRPPCVRARLFNPGRPPALYRPVFLPSSFRAA